MQIHYYKGKEQYKAQQEQEINGPNINGLGCQEVSSDQVEGQGEKVRL